MGMGVLALTAAIALSSYLAALRAFEGHQPLPTAPPGR
jgi:hypothetical protein